MTRSELVAKLAAQNPNFYLRDIELIIDTIIGTMSDALIDGERIEIRGFGSFSVKERAPRIGRNPRTGEKVEVPGKRMPAFKAGKELRDRLNEGS